MTDILPAVMPSSYADLKEKMSRMEDLVPMVQIDIMDGVFVPSKSWPYTETDDLYTKMLTERELFPSWDTLSYEVDLMVSKPETIINDWVMLGARRIIIHAGSTEHMDEIIRELSGRVEIGIALHLDTPLSFIEPYKNLISVVQCMGIARPGFQREPFSDAVIPKIREVKSQYPDILVSIDGGVSLATAQSLKEAGAERLVSGSAIFDSDNPKEVLTQLASA